MSEQDGGAVGVVLDAQACAVRAVFFTQPVGGVIGETVGGAVFVDQVGEPASFVVVQFDLPPFGILSGGEAVRAIPGEPADAA